MVYLLERTTSISSHGRSCPLWTPAGPWRTRIDKTYQSRLQQLMADSGIKSGSGEVHWARTQQNALVGDQFLTLTRSVPCRSGAYRAIKCGPYGLDDPSHILTNAYNIQNRNEALVRPRGDSNCHVGDRDGLVCLLLYLSFGNGTQHSMVQEEFRALEFYPTRSRRKDVPSQP